MNNKKCTTSPNSADWNKPFSAIAICRADLEYFFPKEAISKLSADDMEAIADKYGDRIWCPDCVEILHDVAVSFIDE